MEFHRGGDQRRPKRPQRVAETLREALFLEDAELLPAEYDELVLCREFGWLPSEIDGEDGQRIAVLLAMLNEVYRAQHRVRKR